MKLFITVLAHFYSSIEIILLRDVPLFMAKSENHLHSKCIPTWQYNTVRKKVSFRLELGQDPPMKKY